MPSAPLTVYTYAKCSTCRDAVAWLRDHGLPFVERPICEQPPSRDELRRMLAHQGGQIRRLFNTSGLRYRALGLAEKLPGMTEAEALNLLASDGRLVKRPFLLGADFGLVGFRPGEWAGTLARDERRR